MTYDEYSAFRLMLERIEALVTKVARLERELEYLQEQHRQAVQANIRYSQE